jgi:hypothetical protein
MNRINQNLSNSAIEQKLKHDMDNKNSIAQSKHDEYNNRHATLQSEDAAEQSAVQERLNALNKNKEEEADQRARQAAQEIALKKSQEAANKKKSDNDASDVSDSNDCDRLKTDFKNAHEDKEHKVAATNDADKECNEAENDHATTKATEDANSDREEKALNDRKADLDKCKTEEDGLRISFHSKDDIRKKTQTELDQLVSADKSTTEKENKDLDNKAQEVDDASNACDKIQSSLTSKTEERDEKHADWTHCNAQYLDKHSYNSNSPTDPDCSDLPSNCYARIYKKSAYKGYHMDICDKNTAIPNDWLKKIRSIKVKMGFKVRLHNQANKKGYYEDFRSGKWKDISGMGDIAVSCEVLDLKTLLP